MAKGKRGFGQITKLPSGRYRARYMGPDRVRHSAPYTFDAKHHAEAWLTDERRLLAVDGAWTPPKDRAQHRAKADALTFGTYAERWLAGRRLEARTRAHYRSLLDRQLLPTLKAVPMRRITPDLVREWYAVTAVDTPTLRAHAYGLLRTILGDAVQDELVRTNPCHIRGAGNAKRVHKVKPATLAELETIVAELPERYRLMVLLAAWCQLRFGELSALRRGDISTRAGKIRVRRVVVRADGQVIVKKPKSDAG